MADEKVGKNFNFFKNFHTSVFEVADNEFAITFWSVRMAGPIWRTKK